jgi:hypothetical protein
MNPFPGWWKRRSAGLLSRASRCVEKFFVLCALFLALAMSSPAAADPLGERIIMGIEQGLGYTDASLLLVTRDLKWYGENMHRLPPEVKARVEQIRVNLASEAATSAARPKRSSVLRGRGTPAGMRISSTSAMRPKPHGPT